MKYESQLQITTAAAVPPLTVNQTALVTNFNADLLDGQHGAYYATAASLGGYLPLTGGTLTGTLTGTVGIFTTLRASELTSLLGSNGPITITPDGTGHVHINSTDIRLGPNNTNATLATRGTGDLILRTNEGSAVEGFIRIYDGANGNIEITPNGTGTVVVGKLSGSTASFSGQITSTLASGTAPLVITSNTVVANLNSDFLDGQHGSFYQNAGNLNAGTLQAARLPAFSGGDVTSTAGTVALTLANSGVTAGTYTKVTVDAKGRVTTGALLASADLPTYTGTITSGQVTTALGFTPYNATNPSGYITSTASITGYSGGISVSDSRAVVTTPQSINMGVVFDFKQNTTDGLSDGGTYFGEMTFRQYGSTTDWSGGLSHQLGFTDNGNIWQRSGSNTTWGAWKKLLDTSNFSSHALPLSGGTLTGQLFSNSKIETTGVVTGSSFSGAGTGLTGTAASLTAGAVPWTGVTGKPTTLAGYGITDALPITGGALTGTISIDTSGSTALVSSVVIKRSGQSSVNFGQYPGAWRSALQIQSNASDRLLFLAPPEADYQFGMLRSANGGLKIDVGGTTANQGTNAVTIDTAGTANFPVGLQQNGSAVLTAASTSAPNLSVGGSAGSVAWTGVTGKPTTLAGYGITNALPLSGGTLTGGLTGTSANFNGTFIQTGEALAVDACAIVHNSNVESYYQLSRRLQAFSHLGSTTTLEIEAVTLGNGGYGGEAQRTTWRISSRGALYVTRHDEHGGAGKVFLKILNDTAVPDANGQDAKYVVGLVCGNTTDFVMVWMRARFLQDSGTSRWVTIARLATATPSTVSGSAMTYSSGWIANTGFTNTSFTEVVPAGKFAALALTGVLTSTVATGTAPLVVASTTAVANLNSDLLDGQHGAYYQDAGNLNAGTILAARMPAYTGGDVTSPAGSVALTLANSGVTAGTYRSVTVDAKGRVTAGTNPTTLGGYGITDALPIGGGTLTGKLSINSTGAWNDAQALLTVGSGGDGRIQVRHIWGKSAANNNADHLWLNYQNANGHVQIGDSGGGNNLYVSGQLYAGGYFGGSLVLNAGNYGAYSTFTGTVTGTNFSGPGTGLTGTASSLTAGAVPWSGVTGKPTTLAGYGITDAMYQVDPNGFTQGDIYGSGNMQRLWGTDSVQNLIAFRPPTTVEYTTDGVNWTATTISSDVFDGKVFGKWGGFSMNVGSNIGAWTKVRMTWVNFGYHFFSHFTLAHSTNGHSMNFVFYKSDLNGVFSSEAYRVNGISSWPGYTFTSHVNVSGHWDTRDVRMVFELNGNNGPSGYPNNAISIGHIGIMGGYSSFNRVFDWDGNRNITLFGNLTLPGNVSATGTVSGSSFSGAGTNLTGTANSLNVGGYSARWATGRTIALTGDVTGTSGAFDGTAALSFGVTIANSAVTYAKIQNVATASVLGNSSASVAQAPAALSMATLAGMLSNQAMNINGSAASVPWSGVTGKPTTVTGYGITDAMKIFGAPGVDLNTLTTAGVYRISNTEANRPNDWGQLLVMYGGSDTITQIYGHYVDGTLKTRSGNPTNVGGSGSWSPWRTLLGDHNYNSYALPLTGGTLTGGLSGTTGSFSGEVTWSGWNSGNARAVRIGYSGGNYGGIGYGINYTSTTGSHTYAFADAVTRIDLADGIQVYSAAAGTAGAAVSWTTLLEATRGNGNLRWKGNTVLDSNNYNSFALPLSGGTMTGNIILPATGYVGLNGGSTFGIGTLATNRNSGVFDTVESTGTDPLELNYYQGGAVKIGSGTYGSKSLYAAGIFDGGNQVLHAGNYNSYALGILGDTFTIADWNTLTAFGSRRTAPNGADVNGPPINQYGNLLVYGTGDGVTQLHAGHDGRLAWRTKWNTSDWTSWVTALDTGNYTSYPPARWATGRTISLTGDVTGTSGTFDGTANLSFAATIANSSVTYAKIQNVAVSTVLGNSSASVAQAPAALSMSTLAGMLSNQTMNINGSSASCTGNAATATNGFTVKPGWAGNQNLILEISNFNNSLPSGFYQGYQATNSPSATWYNLINIRHSNTANDHGFQLAMSYYDEVLWSRSYQGGTGANNGTFTTWRAHLHSGNFSSYALPLTGGTLTGALTATSFSGAGTGLTGTAASLSIGGSAGSVAASGITGQTGMWTSAARPGPYRLYRRDVNDAYSVQNYWTGTYWRLDGYYSNDTVHAGCSVAYADTAGSVSTIADGAVSTTAKLANSVVTYAKIQNVGSSSVLGNTSASVSQAPQEITFSNLGAYINGVARAWVTFNENPSTGAITINASFGISSVTRINYGQYRVNFSTAFADAHYAVSGTIGYESNGGYLYGGFLNIPRVATPKTTTYCEVTASYGDGNTYNARFVHVVFDR